ncbi:MAG: ABC transporter ATP-binding protein [Alphaproteobacteria bacterium]|nr:ABC transporter ATP-binding protein [Alphaproteobacteria bacterium]
MTILLEVAQLQISYSDADGVDVRLLRGVDLVVNEREVVAVVGESGCGKSITAKAILGVLPRPPLRIEGGAIRYRGRDLLPLGEADYHALRGSAFTLVPQHPLSSLNPVFTVAQQFFDLICFQGKARVSLGQYWRPRLSRRTRDAVRARTIEALHEVSLPDPESILERYPFQLSGGMSQRVLIAMALLSQPAIVIADEPGTALDVTIESQINDLLLERVQARGMAMIYITHDLGIASQLADRVYVMYAGRVVEEGPTETVFTAPRHPYTAGLLKAVPKVTNEPFAGIRGTLPDPKALDGGCAFRWRCAYATPACGIGVPPLAEVGPGRRAACIRAGDISLAA